MAVLPSLKRLTLKEFIILLASDFQKQLVGYLQERGILHPSIAKLGSDGLLYTPFVSGGLPPGQTVAPGTETYFATNSDTYISLSSYAGNAGIKLFSVYQNSGVAVTFQIADSSGTVIFNQSINNAVITTLSVYTTTFSGAAKVRWSAAAGASQYCIYQPQVLTPTR